MTEAVIVDVVRTASGKGKPGGALHGVHPSDLLAGLIRTLVETNELDPALIDDVIAGCVHQVGDQALNIARIAALTAGLPVSVPGTTIDRQCGSSQQAAHFAAQGVIAGAYDIVIAGGVESMSRVPMGSTSVGGAPMATLATRFPNLPHQGIGAELMATRWKLDRETLDRYAADSHARAVATREAGGFDTEIVPVTLPDGAVHTVDETVRATTTAEGLSGLRPAFEDPQWAQQYPEITAWSITPGNSSPLTDGASAALIMSAEKAAALGLTPRARFHSFAVVGSDPEIMLSGPIPATHKVLDRAGLSISDIDAFEVNEAFASVPLAWSAEFDVDPAKLNPRGGAIALGHPLGASGTRLLTTLVNHLEATGGRYGLQTMCEGNGMANATIIERI
ncbi:Acetyl-CoA acetyltransferase OS=Tsukamurella paurometabola (strain ATCC 8368 / DSM / CCUG 35730/ CIP 100753 / JCM 10117 / KCTC 9821 / NBRC 16120 / NCIMB 702349 / NCTC 13040) OX=521096 GN=Tpau_0775 PE=3 SV=1 [Tsukamurella paurometabola]|uniref:Acetyl-CoA acetyltransferase n=1 Tax=Tsukamurella paurometabola (strain ATCC 8368 / DSM 20162 / CCUG 35730 / CIP 100753 / JCM 10117 / KCTC 9821 / NBRC 16120 / NCIMB 702349 / NCTC 13040) TaxID=521096 RepID=D5UTQ7_TSUPD|nr:thiolase family protein [Tsukamurella paurometabola]ADG77411.1 acetyl-CoA acetyltransferase [Tsukamurella paurometabola DSM 20162]SUP26941.1 Putative acyltransferase Rv0859 [Tsukamurella paurometabola]